jgi:hypothetical protein
MRGVTNVGPFANAVEEFGRLKTSFLSWELEDHPDGPFAQIVRPEYKLVQNQEHFHQAILGSSPEDAQRCNSQTGMQRAKCSWGYYQLPRFKTAKTTTQEVTKFIVPTNWI